MQYHQLAVWRIKLIYSSGSFVGFQIPFNHNSYNNLFEEVGFFVFIFYPWHVEKFIFLSSLFFYQEDFFNIKMFYFDQFLPGMSFLPSKPQTSSYEFNIPLCISILSRMSKWTPPAWIFICAIFQLNNEVLMQSSQDISTTNSLT